MSLQKKSDLQKRSDFFCYGKRNNFGNIFLDVVTIKPYKNKACVQ
jgi:hypothetical protein